MAKQTVASLTAALEAEIINVYTATTPADVDREILERALENVAQGFVLNYKNGNYRPASGPV